MEAEQLKNMSLRLMSAVISGNGDKEDNITRKRNEGQKALSSLLSAVQRCQARYGGKSELATEDDIRVMELCERWTAVLAHGMRSSQMPTTPSLQTLVEAGINFALNINSLGTALWNYTKLHLTKHEEERFQFLKAVNTPVGYFKAFLRAALNERSLERYLHGWVGHSLVTEYYEEWAVMRDPEATSLLPNMAAGLASVLFALSIDKASLNESQLVSLQVPTSVEPVIALKAPVVKVNQKRKPIRQVISFDTVEDTPKEPVTQTQTVERKSNSSSWRSAPPTCVSSPDSISAMHASGIASQSEPTTSDCDVKKRHFFPEELSESILNESPGQILSRLSEKARDIFSSKKSLTGESASQKSSSSASGTNKQLSECDSEEELAEGSVSCLELCFPEDEEEDGPHILLTKQQQENLALQFKLTQLEISHQEKISKLERTIVDLNRENDRLKEQVKKYVSAIQMLKQDGPASDEVKQYEAKLVQVAEMHAELMEFNEVLQRRLQGSSHSGVAIAALPASSPFSDTTSPVQIWIPSAFLNSSGTKSFHVYQIFLKVQSDEWNVYRRYSEFRKLYSDLKNTHPDIAPFKFPPKKALGKKEAWLVERRRGRLQAWLRHVILALPQLRQTTSRAQLVALLPFFGASGSTSSPGSPSRPTLQIQ